MEACSRTFNLDKADGKELIHLFEFSHSAFYILSLLVQDHFLERKLSIKLSTLKRISRKFSASLRI